MTSVVKWRRAPNRCRWRVEQYRSEDSDGNRSGTRAMGTSSIIRGVMVFAVSACRRFSHRAQISIDRVVQAQHIWVGATGLWVPIQLTAMSLSNGGLKSKLLHSTWDDISLFGLCLVLLKSAADQNRFMHTASSGLNSSPRKLSVISSVVLATI